MIKLRVIKALSLVGAIATATVFALQGNYLECVGVLSAALSSAGALGGHAGT